MTAKLIDALSGASIYLTRGDLHRFFGSIMVDLQDDLLRPDRLGLFKPESESDRNLRLARINRHLQNIEQAKSELGR